MKLITGLSQQFRGGATDCPFPIGFGFCSGYEYTENADRDGFEEVTKGVTTKAELQNLFPGTTWKASNSPVMILHNASFTLKIYWMTRTA